MRGGIYGSQIGFDVEESDIAYEVDVVWDSLVAGVDFHPLKTALRLSGGFIKNDNRLELLSRPTAHIRLAIRRTRPRRSVRWKAVFASMIRRRLLGLGWDWSRDKSLFGMSLDLGIVDQGDPTVFLRGSGTLLGNPSFEQDIAAESTQLEDEADVDIVPFFTVGFQFRF